LEVNMRITARARLLFIYTILLSGVIGSAWGQTQPEAGFITLEENTFYFHLNSYFNRVALRSSPARIWYVYQPADEDPSSKPVFIFFNGGPGGATSCGLLAAYTGNNAVMWNQDTGEGSIIPNPASWTRIGNLLYIDARNTGFSYSLMDNPGDDARRQGEFDAQNYNSYTDGADFVRVLLRFLAGHPAIQSNRVVLVPESYGGIRTIVMLHFLLYYENYANGLTVYQDPALVDEIRNHYDAVFPEYRGGTVPPGVVARQFGHQILIQTALAWSYQRTVQVEILEAPGSVLDELAAETGVPYIRYRDQPGANQNPTPNQIRNYIIAWIESLGRDPYLYARPDGYLNGHRAAAAGLLTQLGSLNLMIGKDAMGIPEMYASARSQAYKVKRPASSGVATPILLRTSPAQEKRDLSTRLLPSPNPEPRHRPAKTGSDRGSAAALDLSSLVGPPPQQKELLATLSPASEDDLAAIFGSLEPWDRFFIDLNYEVSEAFSWNRVSLREYDIVYQSSLLFGRMFLENTAWVETFATDAAYDIVVFTPALPDALAMYTSILNGSYHDTAGPPGATRPGQIILSYRPSSVPGSAVTSRTIRFPLYSLSGHAVTMTEPIQMLEDVIAWLRDTGIPSAGH
jgi:hypothetical protein